MFTFLTEKKTVMDQQEVCSLNFHQQIMVVSSQNNVRKYHTNGHEQVFSLTATFYQVTNRLVIVSASYQIRDNLL